VKAIEARQQEIAKQRDIVKQATSDVARLTPTVSELEKLVALDDVSVSESIYRMGGIILGTNRKAVYYHLARGGPAQVPLHLEQIGQFPILRRDNELYAIITDVSPLQKPDYFVLTYTSEIGKPPDSAPLRPSIDQTKAGAGPADAQHELRLKNASKDFILAFPRKLKANEIAKITISTYYPYVSSDKTTVTTGDVPSTKHEVVTEESNLKVLDAAEYPQVHDLYHYNLATGVVVSSLHDPAFTKVKTQAGANPTYAVVQDNGNKRVFPVMLFSFYYTPKDIVQKWSTKDLIPIPTIGFAFSAPADNFFVGGSSEIRRNVQAVYGLHYGKVTKRGPIPVDETASAAAPNTRKQFEPGWFVGLSFNINFIKDLFSGK
jgi:hypothetical protein